MKMVGKFMWVKYFVERLEGALQELKEVSKLDLYVFSKSGEFIAGTDELPGVVRGMVTDFIDSLAELQTVKEFHLSKVMVQGQLEYVLVSDVSNSQEQTFIMDKMVVSQIRNLHMMAYPPLDEKHLFRQLLMGNVSGEQARSAFRKAQIEDVPRNMYVIDFEDERTDAVMETLRNLFLIEDQDYVIDINDNRCVLMRHEDLSDEENRQFAYMIVDNLQMEAMMNVHVGYSGTMQQYMVVADKYQDICSAMKISEIFYPKERVIPCGRLGIGQLIHQLPVELCNNFLKEVFPEDQINSLDDEARGIINALLENNLNISEAARQLYLHRNTLVYRLERLEKSLGLDIRKFEDAMMFRIAMMVQAHLRSLA